MKNILRSLGAAVAVCASALLVSSCYYDPAYSSTSVSGSYSSGGYGYGHGYGGSNFNTSVFVSTGNPQWGYDPYNQSYYDYRRRAYYDPYLYGYYPIGYRPPVLIGIPHPYGYRAGRYCPPPRVVRYNTVPNYRNREYAYRASNYDWARQVRQRPIANHREETRPNIRRNNQSGWNSSRPTDTRNANRNANVRRQPANARNTQSTSSSRTSQRTANQRQEEARNQQRLVSQRQAEARNQQRNAQSRPQARKGNRAPQPQAAPPTRKQRQEEARKEEERNIRSLGQSRR